MGSFFNYDGPLMRFLSRVGDFLILNILFLLCCIPIITAGTSMTALYSVTLKMAKGEDAYIAKGFFKAFKENFKQSTAAWLIMLILGIVLYIDYRISSVFSDMGGNIFRVFLTMIAIFYLNTLLYLFPYIARFKNTIKNAFKNALLISILNFPWTIAIIAIFIGAVILTFLNATTLSYGILLWLTFGFSLIAYVYSIIFRRIFAKYEIQEES